MIDDGLNIPTDTQEHKCGRFDKKNICLLVILLLFFGVFFWLLFASKVESFQFDNEDAHVISGNWDITYGDTVLQSTLPADIDGLADQTVTFTTTLSGDYSLGNSLIFYANQSWIKVYLNGNLVNQSDMDRQLPFPMIPGSGWYFVRLPTDWQGLRLTIEQTSPFEEYCKKLPAVYIGTKAAFLYMIMKQGAFSFFVSIPLIMLGICLLFINPFFKSRRIARRLSYLGMFAIAISIWSLLESKITQLFAGNMPLWGYVLFSCFFLLPFLFMGFLLTFRPFEKSRYMNALYWITAVSFVVVQFLQITGVFYYLEMVPVVHILIIIIIAGILRGYLPMHKDKLYLPKEQKADISIYKGIIIFAVFGGIDILRFYMHLSHDSAVRYTRLGLLVFIAYLAYSAIIQASDLQFQETRQRIYRELAFTDILTGLPNRTAFEQEMDRHRENKGKENLIIMITDLNNLKFINDNYGHACGDAAIQNIALCLQNSFYKNSCCFRIGGDEFCVISTGLTEHDFLNCYGIFLKGMSETAIDAALPLSAACGYKKVDETGIDECLKIADGLMYESKRKYKEGLQNT